MPYKNIFWIKLKLELLDDIRWQDQCTERQQLLYIKLILLAGRLDNDIPNDPNYLKREVNYKRYPSELTRDLDHLSSIFDKLIVDTKSIRFSNFNELHNLGKTQKPERERPEKRREEKRRKEPRIYPESSPPYRLALFHWNTIHESGATTKKPDFQKWADVFRKIHDIDNRPWDFIGKILGQCLADDFWITNILSPAALRKALNKGTISKFIPDPEDVLPDSEFTKE